MRAISALLSIVCSLEIIRASPACSTQITSLSEISLVVAGHKSHARLSHTEHSLSMSQTLVSLVSLKTYSQSTFSVFSSVCWWELKMSRERVLVETDLGRDESCQLNTLLGTGSDMRKQLKSNK